jgi:hypothetical protein
LVVKVVREGAATHRYLAVRGTIQWVRVIREEDPAASLVLDIEEGRRIRSVGLGVTISSKCDTVDEG